MAAKFFGVSMCFPIFWWFVVFDPHRWLNPNRGSHHHCALRSREPGREGFQNNTRNEKTHAGSRTYCINNKLRKTKITYDNIIYNKDSMKKIECLNHPNLVRDQVGAVEADAELANHTDVSSSCHCLHERLGPGLCNGSEVVDQLILGHANARVLDGQGRVGLVRNNLDEEVGLGLSQSVFY